MASGSRPAFNNALPNSLWGIGHSGASRNAAWNCGNDSGNRPGILVRAFPSPVWAVTESANALKHAFPAGRAGQICMNLSRKAHGACVLEISDDGVGLAPGSVEDRKSTRLNSSH